MIKVFIDGREGTTGLRIQSRLASRQDVSMIEIAEELRKDPEARKRCIRESDVTFLCLPDAAAMEAAALAEGTSARLIDASTAHRTNPGWAYGFPELSEAHWRNVASSARISVPGCHASGMNVLVYPMVKSGLMPLDYPVACHSITGYTGGGKKMIAQYESEARDAALTSPRQYGLGQTHKHLKEMQAVPGLAYAPAFNPIVADFPCGMAVTVPVFPRLLNRKCSPEDVYELFRDWYQGKRFIHVLPPAEAPAFLSANALAGRDDMEILISGNEERILLISRFDNLGKGASGAAIECFNIAMGLPAETGLILSE